MWSITRASACRSSSSRTERYRCQEEGAARGAHGTRTDRRVEGGRKNGWLSGFKEWVDGWV
jgi:hypothetical protein